MFMRFSIRLKVISRLVTTFHHSAFIKDDVLLLNGETAHLGSRPSSLLSKVFRLTHQLPLSAAHSLLSFYSLWFFQLRNVFFLLNMSFEKAVDTPI
jgi:hypothetical protein